MSFETRPLIWSQISLSVAPDLEKQAAGKIALPFDFFFAATMEFYIASAAGGSLETPVEWHRWVMGNFEVSGWLGMYIVVPAIQD